jgi:hypothetical protein
VLLVLAIGALVAHKVRGRRRRSPDDAPTEPTGAATAD